MNIPPDEFAEARRMLVELLKQDDDGPVHGIENLSTDDRLSLLSTCSAMIIEHALCAMCGYRSADAMAGLDALVVNMHERIGKLCAVAIRPVDRNSYDVRHTEHPLMRECAWYATDDDAMLGVVIHDLADHDFSWLMLTQKNEQGPGYTAINLATSLPTEEAATQALHRVMRQYEGEATHAGQ